MLKTILWRTLSPITVLGDFIRDTFSPPVEIHENDIITCQKIYQISKQTQGGTCQMYYDLDMLPGVRSGWGHNVKELTDFNDLTPFTRNGYSWGNYRSLDDLVMKVKNVDHRTGYVLLELQNTDFATEAHKKLLASSMHISEFHKLYNLVAVNSEAVLENSRLKTA